MRISPEFPCDNPAIFTAFEGKVRFVLLRAEPAADGVPTAHAAVRPSGIFLTAERDTDDEGAHAASGAVEELDPETFVMGELVAVDDELAPATEREEPFFRDLVPIVAALAGEHRAAVEALFARLELPATIAERTCLARIGVVDGDRVSATFAAEVRGFRALLRGEEADLGALGGRMLDEWLAELLASLAGDTSRRNELRRALRSRGVCAFGLVEAA